MPLPCITGDDDTLRWGSFAARDAAVPLSYGVPAGRLDADDSKPRCLRMGPECRVILVFLALCASRS